MKKAHKIKLNPTPEQETYFYRASGVARFIWNWCLAEYNRRQAAGEEVDWNDIKKKCRIEMHEKFPWVFEVTKCALEQAVNDLRQAINTYYKTKKTNPKSKAKFPKKRKRSRKIGGFGLNNDQFSTADQTVRIPKLGFVNMTETLRFQGQVLNGRIKEEAGQWFLIVTVETVEVERTQPVASPLRSIGLDVGLKTLAVLSDGSQSETQAYYRQAEQRLKRLQRGLARKQKGSKNRAKWRRKVSRAYRRIADLRRDYAQKLTTKIVQRYDIVCVEDLSLKGLCQTSLAKSFHDAAIGQIMFMLDYKLQAQGGKLQKVNRFFPSSKRCHACGNIYHELQLAEREWTCRKCLSLHDRDRNAAINLELEGLSLLAGSGFIGVTTVEFATATALAMKQQVVDCEAVRINRRHLST